MTIQAPQQWEPKSYLKFIRLETSGARAMTHLALLTAPDGRVCRAYVKHYPDALFRGLFNEWFGHIMLSAMGVPQPPAVMMPAPVPDTGGQLRWAFCSTEPSPTFDGTAKQLYNLNEAWQYKTLVKRLFVDCKHLLPGLVAADQILMHADRNIGNIAFTGKNSFVAIDSGGILGGEACHPWHLHKHQGWATSKLIEQLVRLQDLSPGFKNSLLAAAQCAAEQFFLLYPDITRAINYRQHSDVDLCFDATWWRALEAETLFRQKLNLI